MSVTGRIEQLTPELIAEWTAKLKAERKARRIRKRVLAGKACGAKTRTGKPCVATGLKNGRCKMHGGHHPPAGSPEAKAKGQRVLAARLRNAELRKQQELSK
jgi:hypothetical protein